MIAAIFLGLLGGFLAPLSLASEAMDSDDGEGGLAGLVRTIFGGGVLVIVLVFLGVALLVHVGIGEALFKPLLQLISRWIDFLSSVVEALIGPILKLVGL